MKFCPTCDVRLKKDNTTSVLTCPKCNYTEGGPVEEKQSTVEDAESDFLVLLSLIHISEPTRPY